MSKHGALSRSNIEWGSKARKEEDRLRSMNNKARRQTIAEQDIDEDLDDIVLIEPDVEFEDDRPWYDQGDGFEDWQADDIGWLDQQFFDEPA
jgi:hypothetical protein